MSQMNGKRSIFCEPVRLHLILPSELEKEWPFLQEQLLAEPDIWDSQYGLEEIRMRLMANQSQFWLIKAGEMRLFWSLSDVLIRHDTGRRILKIWWARGQHCVENLPSVINALKTLIKAQNYHSIVVVGRKGWERALAPMGFRLRSIETVVEL